MGIILAIFLLQTRPAIAQTLTVERVDTTGFPVVHLYLASQETPLTDFSDLTLRENGVPIPEVTGQVVPVGLEVAVVIDAVDEAEWKVAKDTIIRFAERTMSQSGLDRVTVWAGDGRLLLPATTDPNDIPPTLQAAEFIPRTASLNPVLQEAVSSEVGNGRYATLFILTEQFTPEDVGEIPTLANQANKQIFVGILGESATGREIERTRAFFQPTGGTYATLPTSDGADAIYLTWQQRSNKARLTYRSLQTRSGSYPITFSLNGQDGRAQLTIELNQPALTIMLAQDSLTRTGPASDTPLADLQPQTLAVPVQVTWPDGTPRTVQSLSWTVNDAPQPNEEGFVGNRINLQWPLNSVDTGLYKLQVTITDTLGFTATTDDFWVSIKTERPLPPTPTPTPIPPPPPTPITERINWGRWLSIIGLTAVCLITWQGIRYTRAKTKTEEPAPPTPNPTNINPPTQDAHPVYLIPLFEEATPIKLDPTNQTIGRDPQQATITLPDPTVSPLHARIRWRNGSYWLYDEGSASGTTRNYNRLSLAPQPLQDGDVVGIGRLNFRFQQHTPT